MDTKGQEPLTNDGLIEKLSTCTETILVPAVEEQTMSFYFQMKELLMPVKDGTQRREMTTQRLLGVYVCHGPNKDKENGSQGGRKGRLVSLR